MIRQNLFRFLTPAGLAAVCGLLFAPTACDNIHVTRYFERAAVVSAAPLATDAGVRVFRNGGNAFDAAVVVGFVLAVVDPEAGNIGGGGFAVMRHGASGEITTLDFRETAPAAAHEAMFLDDSGRVLEGHSLVGAKAAGVPGTVAGLYAIWQKYGSLPWEDLVRTAADLADTGFTVDERLAATLAEYADSLRRYPETARLFAPTGATPSKGERFVQSDLAHTLYQIAAEGPEAFYTGAIAALIDSTMRVHGGLITRDDLAAYKAIWRKPVHVRFDSLDVYSMPPPSSGGIVLGQILKIIEPFDMSAWLPDSPEYLRLLVESSRLAFADRATHLGDPDFYEIPAGLLDDSYLRIRRELIPASGAGSSSQIGPGMPMRPETEATTHFSVCDADGNMVALTYTLNSWYGSLVTVDGAGFLLNNEMDDFSIKAGEPNQFGLVGGDANKIVPGKRMLSSMTPTLVLNNGRPCMVLGSPGGSKIISAVAQTILNVSRFNMSLNEAVLHPRVHHQWIPDKVSLEQGGYSVAVIQRLIREGYDVEEVKSIGNVNAILIESTGLMQAVADTRRQGVAGGY